jgi:hypothetical protein
MGKKRVMDGRQRRGIVLMMPRREGPMMMLVRGCGPPALALHRWRRLFLAGFPAISEGTWSRFDAAGAVRPRTRESRTLPALHPWYHARQDGRDRLVATTSLRLVKGHMLPRILTLVPDRPM